MPDNVIDELIQTLEAHHRMPYELLRQKLIAQYGYKKFRRMQCNAFHAMLHVRWTQQKRRVN